MISDLKTLKSRLSHLNENKQKDATVLLFCLFVLFLLAIVFTASDASFQY